MGQVTDVRSTVGEGQGKAAEELLSLLYDELRRVAARQMALEPGTQTLQATALVHEAWLRVAGKGNPQFANRAHFFAAAAEAMRRILIENARRKHAAPPRRRPAAARHSRFRDRLSDQGGRIAGGG